MRRAAARPGTGWLLLAAVAALLALQFLSFRPGAITPDTINQFSQIRDGRYEDWHPPVTTWLWKQLTRTGGGTDAILLFDCLLYWTGFGLVAERLRRLGHLAAAMLALAVAALPVPLGQMGAILKDPLLTASLLAATGLLASGTLGGGRLPAWLRFAAIPLIVLAGAIRFNSVAAAAPLLLLALGPPRRPVPILAGLIGCGLLLAGASYAINTLALKPRATRPIISLVQFDMAGIAARSTPAVYPAEMRPSAAEVASCYADDQYNRADYDDCNDLADNLLDAIDARPHGLVSVWGGAMLAHPLAYAGHRLAHWNWNQRWLVARVPDDAVYVMSEPNDLGLRYVEGANARLIARFARVMAQSPLGRPATWTAVALALLIIAPHLASRALVTALAGSGLLYALGYLPFSVAPDLRYNIWTMLAAMIGLLVALVELPRTTPARRDLALAAVPVIIVVAGELIAMAG